MIVLRLLWRVSINLKFAVLVMIGLTVSLIVATVLESMYDTPTAQYWVYQTWYFYGLLGLLFWLIFAVAMSRLPWQKKHLPFLCAHLGILLLLYGSWLTFKFGIDGSLQVTEGRTESTVELNEPLLLISSGQGVKSVPVPWIPPNAKFKPISIPEHGLRIVDFISRAEPHVAFTPSADPRDLAAAAIRFKIAGGPKSPPFMRMGQEAWLWAGDRNWAQTQLGAAMLTILPKPTDPKAEPLAFATKGVEMVFRVVDPAPGKKNAEKTSGILEVGIQTRDGQRSTQLFPFAEPKELVGRVIATGWKNDVQVTILDWLPRAVSDVSYAPSRIQYGQGVPGSAILLEADRADPGDPRNSPRAAKVWLGLGERVTMETRVGGADQRLSLGYFPRRIVLPFGIELVQFRIDRYQGTQNPMEFASVVNVRPGTADGALPPGSEPPPMNHLVSMNEPMKYGGFTFYQASYVDAQPRPTTSIFSVNQDPGRWLKYLGSLLIVLGSIWLFGMRYVTKKKTPAQASAKG
jgi:hypothetical protein